MPRPALATTCSSCGSSSPTQRSRTACWYRPERGARPPTTRWHVWGYATSANPLTCAIFGTRRRACGQDGRAPPRRRGPSIRAGVAHRRVRSVVRPDGELVAPRVVEVEAAAGGEGARRPRDAAPRPPLLPPARLQAP